MFGLERQQNKNLEPAKGSVTRSPFFVLMMFGLVFYALYLLGRSAYDNYQINQTVDKLNTEMAILQQQNDYLKNAIIYYQSEAFLEKAARIHLGLQKPGEKVIALQEKPDATIKPNSNNYSATSSQGDQTPNYARWWQYVIGR